MNDLVIIRDTNPENWRRPYVTSIQEQFGIVSTTEQKENARQYYHGHAVELIRLVRRRWKTDFLTYEFV